MVARSASARPASPSPANSTNEPTTPSVRRRSVTVSTRSVAVVPMRQRAVQPDPDDARHRLVERLAEQDGLGLDPAHAVAQHAERVDHRGVGVGPDQRVGERERPAVVVGDRHDGGEVLKVDLVDDAGAGRDDAEPAEGTLRPAEELVALAVPLVLAVDVERERVGRPEAIDLDRVVDHEVGRDERVDAAGIAAEGRHRVAHGGEVHDGGHAREVLEDHARGQERDLRGRRRRPAARPRDDGRPPPSTMPRPAWRRTFSSRILTVTGARSRSISPASAARGT